MAFILMSSSESPAPPPSEENGFKTATLLKTALANVASKPAFWNWIKLGLLMTVKVPAVTFDYKPPPVKYLTVKIVLYGAIP